MNTNMQRLGDVLSSRMKKSSAAAVPTSIELGIINGNLSLTTDSLPTPIPKGDYMINLMLTNSVDKLEADDRSHYHELPGAFRCLKANDRVLVAWCGNEPVVIAIVVSS